MKFVPVEPPTRRLRRFERTRVAAIEAESGTLSIASTTLGTKEASMRGRPMPSMRLPRLQRQAVSVWVQPS
ncbi:hypothetical protein D3C87_2062270 [compost metagenome]